MHGADESEPADDQRPAAPHSHGDIPPTRTADS